MGAAGTTKHWAPGITMHQWEPGTNEQRAAGSPKHPYQAPGTIRHHQAVCFPNFMLLCVGIGC